MPHQEKKFVGLLAKHRDTATNILEVYCPTHTTVNIQRKGRQEAAPLLAGYVFVLSTREALAAFVTTCYPDGVLLRERRKEGDKQADLLTIPEQQMCFFKDFNENYAEHVIVLERPYSDYAFNPKTNEPNEIIKVVDGPLKGREGYLTRFRRERRLVFNMKVFGTGRYFAVSIPNIWNFKVVRLHNAEGDRQALGTLKERAVDLLVGILQGCGYGDDAYPMLYGMIDTLVVKPLLTHLCRELRTEHEVLSRRMAGLSTQEAELVLGLVRYEHDNPGYVKANYPRQVMRPFLTPTCGMEVAEGEDEVHLLHAGFTEIIRKVDLKELTYYPSQGREAVVATRYYAHVGVIPDHETQRYTLFANWDTFLHEYFLTAGKANRRLVKGTVEHAEKKTLIDSFRNFAPTLYKVLTDESFPVKAVQGFGVGKDRLNALVVTTTTDVDRAKDVLITTCIDICHEINTTTHLAVWRRYLRSVWLHQ